MLVCKYTALVKCWALFYISLIKITGENITTTQITGGGIYGTGTY